MKKTILFLLLITGFASQAQTLKLNQLSSNKLLDSRIIYEDNGIDVFGYISIFQKDQTKKEELLLEYFIYDKNLNKLTSGSFLQVINTGFLFKTAVSLVDVTKNKNSLYIVTGEDLTVLGMSAPQKIGAFYRVLDLTTYKLSTPFSYVDFKRVDNFFFDKKTFTKNSTYPQIFESTNGNGFILSQNITLKDVARSYHGEEAILREFRFYDNELNEKWTFKYNQDLKSKSFNRYEFFERVDNNLIFQKFLFEDNKDLRPKLSLEIIDATTGQKKYEIALDDNQTLYSVNEIIVENNTITVYAATSDFNRKEQFNYEKITGYAKFEFDLSTGKQKSKNNFVWSALAGKLPVDARGKISSYGYIEFIDFKKDKDGKTIVIGEGYKPGTSVKILDLFAFVFDSKMKLIDYHKVEKFKNSIDNLNATGRYLNNIDAFDFMYSQKLPDGGYVYYYADNEKKGWSSNNWVLGIVTYVDGKFDFQKVSLKTNKGTIRPGKAKSGYIMLKEEVEKNNFELRLEKINY